MSIKTPDKYGNIGEIVLGYSRAEEYIEGNPYFGATVGRCANRISKGRFSLDGKDYQLEQNVGDDHLHGGPTGFHQVNWEMDDLKTENGIQTVRLSYLSADGHEGYPGNLKVNVKYSLNDDNELSIEYQAETDKTTIVNMAHHSFFNLKDGGKSDINTHLLKLNANTYTPMNQSMIPTGEIKTVMNTAMDFTSLHKIGDRINDNYEQLIIGKGYDHNYVLDKPINTLAKAAEIVEPETGRAMEVYTTQAGIQFYTGNFLDGSDSDSSGFPFQFRSAFCLETQAFPDSPNNNNFPSIELKPGEIYYQKTIYKFITSIPGTAILNDYKKQKL